LRATFEPKTGSLYIKFTDPDYGPFERTEVASENIDYMLLDFDVNNQLIGIEIQAAQSYFPKHLLEQIPPPLSETDPAKPAQRENRRSHP